MNEEQIKIYSKWVDSFDYSNTYGRQRHIEKCIRACSIYFNEKEEWRDSPVCGSEYEVSNFGRVRSKSRLVEGGRGKSGLRKRKSMMISNGITGSGYFSVTLHSHGKKYSVSCHSLVIDAFVKEEVNEHVNHKDSNRLNNYYKNLEYCTAYENYIHGVRRGNIKTTQCIENPCNKPVVQLTKDGVFVQRYFSINQAHRETGICPKGISAVCTKNKKRYSCGGFKWVFESEYKR